MILQSCEKTVAIKLHWIDKTEKIANNNFKAN